MCHVDPCDHDETAASKMPHASLKLGRNTAASMDPDPSPQQAVPLAANCVHQYDLSHDLLAAVLGTRLELHPSTPCGCIISRYNVLDDSACFAPSTVKPFSPAATRS